MTGEIRQETAVVLAAKVSDRQKVRYRITPEADKLVSMKSLGGQLDALADLFKAVGKADGHTVHSLVGGIGMEPDGSIWFDVIICTEVKP